MDRLFARALILASLVLAAPVAAQVRGFSIVNQTGAALRDVAVRRVGDREWRPLGAAPAPGASARADFAHEDCAFDLRATVAGVGQIVWNGVNLCDVKRVALHRDSAGRRWVDYD